MTVTKMHTGLLIDKNELTPLITWLKIRCKDEKSFDFTPGQFINLKVAEDTYRSYSICSEKPGGDIELATLTGLPGLGANYIKTLKKGSSVSFVGPSGRFFYHFPGRNKVVFVATSTGIAPFIPMMRQAIENPAVNSVILLFGVRNEKHIFFEEKFQNLKGTGKFRYLICLSESDKKLSPPHYSGRVTFYLARFLKDRTDFYLCGNAEMIKDAEEIINSSGLKDIATYTEPFSPIKQTALNPL